MKYLVFLMILMPLSLVAESQNFYGNNRGEAFECNPNYANCIEEQAESQKVHDHRYDRHRHPDDRRYRPHPLPHYPDRYYYPNPYYTNYGHICRNGAYYCGMRYPAPVGYSCYCNLISWGFWGIVTNY